MNNPAPFKPDLQIEAQQDGAIWEYSPARESFLRDIAALLRARKGLGLFIDYGHDVVAPGDTLQAIRNHTYTDILHNIGNADLTSHVDFGRLKRCALEFAEVYGPVEQGAFLKRLGIESRAQRLGQPIELARLTDPSQMGSLFRVMALCCWPGLRPSGF